MSEETSQSLRSATSGFDALFANDLAKANEIFKSSDSPFHLLGYGVCAFLDAALGMEAGQMANATQLLSDADAGAKKHLKAAKATKSVTRFPAGTEWELVQSDSVILHALTLALSESYMGYLQCFYELNSGHSKFTKLYKTVYPSGLDNYATPATSKAPSPSPSIRSGTSTPVSSPASTVGKKSSGFFGRLTGGGSSISVPARNPVTSAPDGPVEELIMSGTAFGYGLFNLVFSLLPGTVRGVVGFLGFKSDRKLALQALAVSANQTDVHSVFAGLVLMTYYGVVLLFTGYQADEQHILKQYRAMVDQIESKYPTGSLWILNRAKLLRMSHNAEGAIKVLQDGLKPDRPVQSFAQADGLLIFELAWTLLSQRRYKEAAELFIKITEVNSWSHATYYYMAAGCHVSLKDYAKAQQLLDAIPGLVDKKKVGGKDLPTEVFIKKKMAFYKEKQKRWTGADKDFAQCIKINPAEELATFWNTHARIGQDIALAHIEELSSMTPLPDVPSPLLPTPSAPPTSTPHQDLDTPDELAIRALLLGITHRTASSFPASRVYLTQAHQSQSQITISTWVGGVACFELAVLDLKEGEAALENKGVDRLSKTEKRNEWMKILKSAADKLDQAIALAPQSVDLSSRLDMRVTMLRDEIAAKREMVEAM